MTGISALAAEEEAAIKLLETKARNLENSKARVECGEALRSKIEAALDEAAAILRDAASLCRSPEVQE